MVSVKRFIISFLTIFTILGTMCTSFSFAASPPFHYSFPEPYCSEWSGYVCLVDPSGSYSFFITYNVVPYVTSSDASLTPYYPPYINVTFDSTYHTSISFTSLNSSRSDVGYYVAIRSFYVNSSGPHGSGFYNGVLTSSDNIYTHDLPYPSGSLTSLYAKGGSTLRVYGSGSYDLAQVSFSDSSHSDFSSLQSSISSGFSSVVTTLSSFKSVFENGGSFYNLVNSQLSSVDSHIVNIYDRLNNLNNWLVGNYYNSLSSWWSTLFSYFDLSGSESTDSLPSDSVDDLDSLENDLENSYTDSMSSIDSISSSFSDSISSFSDGFSAIWYVVSGFLNSASGVYYGAMFCLTIGFVSMVFRRS